MTFIEGELFFKNGSKLSSMDSQRMRLMRRPFETGTATSIMSGWFQPLSSLVARFHSIGMIISPNWPGSNEMGGNSGTESAGCGDSETWKVDVASLWLRTLQATSKPRSSPASTITFFQETATLQSVPPVTTNGCSNVASTLLSSSERSVTSTD